MILRKIHPWRGQWIRSLALIAIVAAVSCRQPSATTLRIQQTSTIDLPQDFGYKMIWFAVKTHDRKKLADVLKLYQVDTCNWSDGIQQAYADKVFITPAIGDWRLAAGWGLLCPGTKNPRAELTCFREKINGLSTAFGEAQLFITYRVNEYDFWAKSIKGKITRLYFYVGETGENIAVEGAPTPVEAKLHLINTLSAEARRDSNYADRPGLTIPDETLVMKIAENWSIDPTQITKRKDVSPGPGLIGMGTPGSR